MCISDRGNTAGVPDFDWVASEEILAELHAEHVGVEVCNNRYAGTVGRDAKSCVSTAADGAFQRIGDVEMYRVDPLVRRAKALQAMIPPAAVQLNPQDAANMGVAAGDTLKVSQGAVTITLPAQLDAGIPAGCAGLQSGIELSLIHI